MKTIILLFLLIASPLWAADSDYLLPREVLKADGVLTITDGSSYFVFMSDGVFHSFPVGISGRCFEGKWKAEESNPLVFTVEAKLGWINGFQPFDDWRRIVFVVYRGQKKANDRLMPGAKLPPKEVWDGYFLIDGFVKIPAPIQPLVEHR